jgi:PucR C-terminal helix-turn-helix domain/GGDEF-like domain
MAADPLAPAVSAIVSVLERGIDGLLDAMLERLLSQPDLKRYDEPHFRVLARRIAQENLLHEIHALGYNRRPPETCPPEAAMAARQAVDLDSPVTVVLQCYRAGHAVLWSAWMQEVERHASSPQLRRRLLEVGSEFMFAYVERCTGFVVDEYTRAREDTVRSRNYRRLQLVRGILEGASSDSAELDYELSIHHVGLVAWGPEAEPVLRRLSAKIGERSLTIPGDDGSVWGWTGRHAEFASGLDDLVAASNIPTDTSVAYGTPASGVAGFRRTHREAQDARSVAARRPAPATSFAKVAIEALALANEERATALVERELGPLARNGPRSERHLATLKAYFSAGQNAAAAAARLGINERTVRNRLQVIEDALGYPPTARRLELETALRFVWVLRAASGNGEDKP